MFVTHDEGDNKPKEDKGEKAYCYCRACEIIIIVKLTLKLKSKTMNQSSELK
jgi:hypothetical protein